jgi:hypothetical protein
MIRAQHIRFAHRGVSRDRQEGAAVRKLISLAAELSEDERQVVVDAIAPKESIASLAEGWESEIARRAERVRSGHAQGKPADDVFARLESKLESRSRKCAHIAFLRAEGVAFTSCGSTAARRGFRALAERPVSWSFHRSAAEP